MPLSVHSHSSFQATRWDFSHELKCIERKSDYWSCTHPVITICHTFEWIFMGYTTCSTFRQTFIASRYWYNALMTSTLSAKHFLCCSAAASITVQLLPASTGNPVMHTTETLADIYLDECGIVVVPPLALRVKRSHDCPVALGAGGHKRPSCCRWSPAILCTSLASHQIVSLFRCANWPSAPQILGNHCSVAIVPWPLSSEYRE